MREIESNPKRQIIRKIVIDLGIMTVIGIFLALIGPFGSIEQPLPVRLTAALAVCGCARDDPDDSGGLVNWLCS